MDCYTCLICQTVYRNYTRYCDICGGEKSIELDMYGLTRRLLINIISTVDRSTLQEIAKITGYGEVTHEDLFETLAECLK